VSLEASLPGGGRALFTSRAEGNMSSVGGLGSEQGAGNREELRLRVGAEALARGFQIHGTAVRRVRRLVQDPPGSDGLVRADGQATSVPGQAALVLAADCLPVAVGCPGAVAILHAGWRGLGEGILEAGVAAVRELGRGGPLGAALGPCAGPCCYEVGPEVLELLGEPGAGHATVDLRAVARRRLLAAGVGEITELGGCTICDEAFFSHRREGLAAGRQAGVAWLS
jgi:YfiH family protein